MRGGAVWQLVGLITRRSQVQILPPLPTKRPRVIGAFYFGTEIFWKDGVVEVDRLLDLLEPTVRGLGYELLGIERGRVGGGQLLRLFIDHESGVAVEDCAKVSRQVGDVLESEQAVRGEYTLEVSSPGLERPLFTLEQHRRFVGELVQVRLRNLVAGRRRVLGVLCEVTAAGIVVEVEGEQLSLPFADIERSRLAVDWQAQKQAR